MSALLCVPAFAFGADASAPIDSNLSLSGSLRGAWWSGSRTLDDEEGLIGAAAWLKAESRLNANAKGLVEGWIRDEDLAASDRRRGRVREAYVELPTQALDMRVGRQIVTWGRADQINPTDNLTPRDFTLLVSEPGDDRLGTVAALAAYRRGDTSFFAIRLPRFRPHTVPIALPAGVSLRTDVPASAKQLALRIDRSGSSGIDWSLS